MNSNRQRRGVTIAMFAILLPVMFVFCAMAINLAQMKLTQTELKIATDAAARAGGRAWSQSHDLVTARDFARQAAALNDVAGDPLVLSVEQADGEIEFGISTHESGERYEFELLTDEEIDDGALSSAVRVNAEHSMNFLFTLGGTSRTTPSASSVASQIDRDIALIIDRSGSMAYFENEDALYTLMTALHADASNGITNAEYIDSVTDYQPIDALADLSLNDRHYAPSVLAQLDGRLLEYAQTFNSEYLPKTGTPEWSRWDLLEQAKQAFFDVLADTDQVEMVSISSFASSARIDVPITEDLELCNDTIDAMYPTGSTAIGDGVLQAAPTLLDGRSHAMKTIIVFTDGENKKGVDPAAAGRRVLREYPNTIIHTVTFSPGAVVQPMKDLAAAGNGQHRHADDGTELIQIFRDLASSFRTIITE